MGGARAGLGQQDLEAGPPDPHGPVRIPRLGPDDVGEASGHPVIGVVGKSARQLDEEHGGRPAVPGVTGGFVAEGGQPVLPGVELDGAPDALDDGALASLAELRRTFDERLDPGRRALVVVFFGQDELAGPLGSGCGGERRGVVEGVGHEEP